MLSHSSPSPVNNTLSFSSLSGSVRAVRATPIVATTTLPVHTSATGTAGVIQMKKAAAFFNGSCFTPPRSGSLNTTCTTAAPSISSLSAGPDLSPSASSPASVLSRSSPSSQKSMSRATMVRSLHKQLVVIVESIRIDGRISRSGAGTCIAAACCLLQSFLAVVFWMSTYNFLCTVT